MHGTSAVVREEGWRDWKRVLDNSVVLSLLLREGFEAGLITLRDLKAPGIISVHTESARALSFLAYRVVSLFCSPCAGSGGRI